ncbi:MAG: Glutathione synthase/Ribosomal protein modification enzyme (glutaminyl transferase)-like protein [Bryobacterales bacterium]|nr:Glutathione synthase/Ribosomal protein modification enzyme (glutaminyl transferase)-like protein [Bryobacterales bacterium]
MPKIGILYGMENTFPPALVDRINSRNVPGITAEHIRIGAVKMADPSGYAVIIDRISQDIEFYRAYLKNAALNGTQVINNPFWWSADDKFFNYALARKLGVAVPNTVVLPHKSHPPGTTVQSMRNLKFPLNWDEVFEYIGFPAFLKPFSGGGWKNVYKVHSPEEFFKAYDETGTICMTLQSAVNFKEYFRCYVVGQEKVRVMQYDPFQPHHQRYARQDTSDSQALHDKVVQDCLTLCRALGYDFNTVEFAVENGIPYAIDFLNPAPDADIHSVGQANFDWVVENVAQLAIGKALSGPTSNTDLRWNSFLKGPTRTAAATSK